VDYFLQEAAQSLRKKSPTPPRELYSFLNTYNFPGNVRELQGLINDAVSTHKSGILSMDSFRAKISRKQRVPRTVEQSEVNLSKCVSFSEQMPTLKEAEQMLIDEAMKRANGNQTIAAGLLGMSRRALNNRLMRKQKK
jgi:DNA-binding NtrC family response regulator